MFRRVHTQSIALVVFFTFCQVIGTMCALPDLSEIEETAILVEENMACPMGGTIVCPPSLTSSPERQVKNSMVEDVDHAPVSVSCAAAPASLSVQTIWSMRSADVIVPVSIGSSSVLRI